MRKAHEVILLSPSSRSEADRNSDSASSESEAIDDRPSRRNQQKVVNNDASSSDSSEEQSESDASEVVVVDRKNKVKEQMKSQIQKSVDSFYRKRNRTPDIVISDSESDVEVPDSSPLKVIKKGTSMELDSSPLKPTKTKLPSFRSYAYEDPSSGSPETKKSISNSKMMESYQIFRKQYPHLTQKVILNALKTKDSINEIKDYLDHLPKTLTKTEKTQGSYRLNSLSRNVTVLSSSPLKASKAPSSADLRLLKLKREKQREEERAKRKAERENIKSSKVVLVSKKSITDRFLTKRRRLYREGEEDHENPISLEDSESEEQSVASTDESITEISPPPKPRKNFKTKKYEDDDDYDPSKPKPKARKPKEDDSKRQKDRDDRFQRRHELEAKLLPEFEQDDDAGLNTTEKFLKLVNNADIRDIIDLSNIKPAEAEVIVKNRPYSTINEFLKVELKPVPRSKVANSARMYSERVVETCKQKLIAYGAIDSLVRQCFSYSKDITKEIVKWGVSIEGQKTGEFSITDVNISGNDEDEEESQSDVDDKNSSDDESDGSDSDIQIIQNSRRRHWKHRNDDDDDNEDEDFNMGRKKLYQSNINMDKVNDKIGYFKKSPKMLKADVKLKDYQQVGVNWLNLLFQKRLSCILADEMGLGKTIQVISLIAHLKQKKYPGPHLIVVPSSTLENWLREFEKFAPDIYVVPYYGSLAEREELRTVLMDEKFDVMVTTYNLATVGKLDQPFLRSFEFNTIVYDEGHMLKNATSDRYKKLTKLRAHFRVLLTGTPLQNNLKELVSLLDFILPEVFDSKMGQLELLFDKKASTKDDEKIEGESYNPLLSQQAIAKAKVMMTPFILRRTKAQVMKDLPKKHTAIEYTDMTPHQKSIYDDQLSKLNEYRKQQGLKKTMSKEEFKKLPQLKTQAINVLMYLRKACLHPLLFRKHYNDKLLRVMSKSIMKNSQYRSANQEYIYEDMEVMSDFELTRLCHQFPNELGKFVLNQQSYLDSGKVTALIKLLTDIVAKGEKVLIFSLFTQMLDILEKVISLKNWKFLRLDGSTAVETRQTMIDTFYQDKTIPIFLLSTKAGGFGINLVCATNVIIYDQSFNPHDDKQAEDRAHRVGQTKEVYVTRLIVKNSIEENILQMAYNKLQLDQSMMQQPNEDILLKTVEDMLAAKETSEPEAAISDEPKVSVPPENAFETNVELEIAANSEEEEDDDGAVEVLETVHTKSSNGGRAKRKRNNITYVDDVDLKGIVESDYEEEPVVINSDFEDGEVKKPQRKTRRMTTRATNSILANTGLSKSDATIETKIKRAEVIQQDPIEIANNIQIPIPVDVATNQKSHYSLVMGKFITVTPNHKNEVLPLSPTLSTAADSPEPIPLDTGNSSVTIVPNINLENISATNQSRSSEVLKHTSVLNTEKEPNV